MQVHTLPPKGGRGRGGSGPPGQVCSCKPNADGRCCLGACGCSKAGTGCSPKCGCRGFKLVCGNKTGVPTDAVAAKPAEPPAKKPKTAAPPPFAGVGHRLADGPFELAAAPNRSRFLDALEARPAAVGTRPSATAGVASASARVPEPADEEVIIIDDDDDNVAVQLKAPPSSVSRLATTDEATAGKPVPKPPPPPPKPASKPLSSLLPKPVPVYDPFNPPQYVPTGGFKPPKGGELRVRELVNLTDASGQTITAAALLDTGNEGCTLITRGAALRSGLGDSAGMPIGSGRVQWTPPVHGVVAGATECLPMLDISYELKGKTVHVRAAITQAHLGCDMIICRKEILMFQNDGFHLSAHN